MDNSIVIPLSVIDHFGVTACSMIYGYVLKSVDESKLKNALFTVADKWRLLAGRIEWDSATQMYRIRVPLGDLPEDYARATFTRAEYPQKVLDTESLTLDNNSAVFLSRPPPEYFRHSSTPDGLGGFATRKLPLLSLHVSVLKNCVCVGLVFTHGAFDATGMGLVARAFNDEFNGRAWDPFALQSVNMITKVVDSTSADPKNLTPALCRLQASVVPMGLGSVATFVGNVLYEKLWQQAERRSLFLGNSFVDQIVNSVKKQVAEEKRGFVSTGDVLLAWVIQAAYQNETATNKCSMVLGSAVSMRSVFEDPAFEQYPHNAFAMLATPEFPISEISTASLADLAVLHRKSIDECRNVAYLQDYCAVANRLGRNVLPSGQRTVDKWVCSNQTIARMDLLDLGTETSQFFTWLKPYIPHHGIILNKFKGGYILEISMRKSRWEGVEKELEMVRGAVKIMSPSS